MKTACPRHSREEHRFEGVGGLLDQLSKNIHALDYFLILIIPLVLLWIHLLPSSTREALMLSLDNWSWISAYTSKFVHLDFTHLFGNLFIYSLLLPLAFILSLVSKRKRHFYAIYIINIIALPILISGLQFYFYNQLGSVMGFSGVLMSFFGFTTVLFLTVVATRFNDSTHIDHALLLLLIQLGIISQFGTVFSGSETNFFMASGFLAGTYLFYRAFRTGRNFTECLKSRSGEPGYSEITVLSMVLIGYILVLGFTSQRGGDPDVQVDMLSHLTGMLFGFSISYVLMRTECSISHICHCAGPDSHCELHNSQMTRIFKKILVRLGIC